MYLTFLKLPPGRSSFDLDRRVNNLFREIGAVQMLSLGIEGNGREIYEIPQQAGAIEYQRPFGGNTLIELNFNNDSKNNGPKQISSAGYLLLVGFGQADYISEIKTKIDSKLGEYIVAKVESNSPSKT